jgi:hypothetical protein
MEETNRYQIVVTDTGVLVEPTLYFSNYSDAESALAYYELRNPSFLGKLGVVECQRTCIEVGEQ